MGTVRNPEVAILSFKSTACLKIDNPAFQNFFHLGLKAFRFPTARKDSCNYRNVKELTKLEEEILHSDFKRKKIESSNECSVLFLFFFLGENKAKSKFLELEIS